jgi:hypothetical protein
MVRKERSHSYDESFLHRDPNTSVEVLEAPRRASEAPPSYHHSAYRTNFGKSRVYVPPPTSLWSIQQAPRKSTAVTTIAPPVPVTTSVKRKNSSDSAENDGEIPLPRRDVSVSTRDKVSSAFQSSSAQPTSGVTQKLVQVKSEKHLDESSKPFDEASLRSSNGSSSPNDKKQYHRDIVSNRFQLAPPRTSRPCFSVTYPGFEDEVGVSMRGHARSNDEMSMSSYEQLGVSAGTDDESGSMIHEERPRKGKQVREQPMQRQVPVRTQQQRPVGTSNSGDDVPVGEDEDNDSLFDFDEGGFRRERKDTNKTKKQSRTRRQDDDEDEDDNSLDQPYGYVQPTQAAWKRKSAQRTLPESAQRTSPQSPPKGSPKSPLKASPSVSFGKDNAIQYFDPDPYDTIEETLDTSRTSLEGRSLNSWYTKSAESEVEDIIKDIFLIGDSSKSRPGRRKLKHSAVAKQRARDQLIDDGTLETFEEEEDSQDATPPTIDLSASDLRERTPEEEEEEDPLTSVWKFFFGGDSADGDEGEKVQRSAAESLACSPKICSPKTGERMNCSKKGSDSPASEFQEFLEYAFDSILGGPSASSGEMDNKSRPETKQRPLQKKKDDQKKKNDTIMPQPSAVERAPTLEEDHRLVELATQAARSMHQIKGLEFDESYNIDFPVDIQFSVVDLEMPLGLIFHENDIGCWVTKVLPNGSASKNGSVQNGDQLAAIDGVSAIHMKVCQIAAAIKNKNAAVELTFLRYAGPLHPTIGGSVAEEGYEVRAETKKSSLTGQPRKSTLSLQGVANNDNQLQAGRRDTEQLTRKIGKEHEPKPQPEKRRFRLFGRRK